MFGPLPIEALDRIRAEELAEVKRADAHRRANLEERPQSLTYLHTTPAEALRDALQILTAARANALQGLACVVSAEELNGVWRLIRAAVAELELAPPVSSGWGLPPLEDLRDLEISVDVAKLSAPVILEGNSALDSPRGVKTGRSAPRDERAAARARAFADRTGAPVGFRRRLGCALVFLATLAAAAFGRLEEWI
jgi:hypothetical protein